MEKMFKALSEANIADPLPPMVPETEDDELVTTTFDENMSGHIDYKYTTVAIDSNDESRGTNSNFIVNTSTTPLLSRPLSLDDSHAGIYLRPYSGQTVATSLKPISTESRAISYVDRNKSPDSSLTSGGRPLSPNSMSPRKRPMSPESSVYSKTIRPALNADAHGRRGTNFSSRDDGYNNNGVMNMTSMNRAENFKSSSLKFGSNTNMSAFSGDSQIAGEKQIRSMLSGSRMGIAPSSIIAESSYAFSATNKSNLILSANGSSKNLISGSNMVLSGMSSPKVPGSSYRINSAGSKRDFKQNLVKMTSKGALESLKSRSKLRLNEELEETEGDPAPLPFPSQLHVNGLSSRDMLSRETLISNVANKMQGSRRPSKGFVSGSNMMLPNFGSFMKLQKNPKKEVDYEHILIHENLSEKDTYTQASLLIGIILLFISTFELAFLIQSGQVLITAYWIIPLQVFQCTAFYLFLLGFIFANEEGDIVKLKRSLLSFVINFIAFISRIVLVYTFGGYVPADIGNI